MTTTERLAQAESRAKAKLEAQRLALAKIQSAQRDDARQTRDQRRERVGTLADDKGLLAWDDTTLAGLFAALARLAPCPDPVAVLEELVGEAEAPARTAVNGKATSKEQASQNLPSTTAFVSRQTLSERPQ